MDLMDIVGGGLAAISGGLTGVLGFGLKALFGWLGEKEKRATLRQTQDHEYRLQQLNIQARGQELESERAIAAEETRRASYDYAPVRQEVWKWVASLISLMRPAITLYLLIVATAFGWTLLYGVPLPYIDTSGFIREIASATVYLTSTAVTWWFGDRPPQKR